MGFRNPITSAVDTDARALAAQALDVAQNGIIPGSRLAADAIDGKTITGANIRTAASGLRVGITSAQANMVQLYTGDAAELIPGQLYVGMDTGRAGGTAKDRGTLFLRPPVISGSAPLPGVTLAASGPSRDGTDLGGWTIGGPDVALTYLTPPNPSSATPRSYVDSRTTRGIASVTTDVNGDATISHGLSVTPASVTFGLVGTGGGQQFGKLSLTAAPTSSSFTVRLFDTRNGAALSGFAVQVAWAAFA